MTVPVVVSASPCHPGAPSKLLGPDELNGIANHRPRILVIILSPQNVSRLLIHSLADVLSFAAPKVLSVLQLSSILVYAFGAPHALTLRYYQSRVRRDLGPDVNHASVANKMLLCF